ALHVSSPEGTPVQQATVEKIKATLDAAEIPYISAELDDDVALVRFPTVPAQLRANEALGEALPEQVIALTLAPRAPPVLAALGLQPMALGLDLRGGVHFLSQVDSEAAIEQLLASYESDIRTELR